MRSTLRRSSRSTRRSRRSTATRAVRRGVPANNVCSTARAAPASRRSSRRCSRSTREGLAPVEVDSGSHRPSRHRERLVGERYVTWVFCDDLTSTPASPATTLKVMLDGSIAGAATNVIIYANVELAAHAAEYSPKISRRGTSAKKCTRASRSRKGSRCRNVRLWITSLSVRTGRLPGGRRPLARASARCGTRSRRATRRSARAKRCNSHCSVARAADASYGSSRGIGPAVSA